MLTLHNIHMAHITLSIPDDLYKKMKEYPEIKWSEIARNAIKEYLAKFERRTTTKELRERIPKEALKILDEISEEEMREFYSKMVDLEWKRLRSTTQI